MARFLELLVLVNGIAGIATFLGVRFVWRRSKNKAKRGFQIIHSDREECPICRLMIEEEEMHQHLLTEHPDELKAIGASLSRNSEERSQLPSSLSAR